MTDIADTAPPASRADIEHLTHLMGELEPILQSLMLNDSTIIDALAQMLATQQAMQSRTEQQIAGLAAELHRIGTDMIRLRHSAAHSPPLAPPPKDPEATLLAHLRPFLPNPVAIDVGANTGEFAETLVRAGYEVFAFEPFAASAAALHARSEQNPGLHAFPFALGETDGSAELLIATDLSETPSYDTSLFHSLVPHPLIRELRFASRQPVTRRSLASLAQEGTIPKEAALLKIDTEGTDLEVIRGSGDLRPAVVMLEFWDGRHPFGTAGHGDLATLTAELRPRGYPSHLLIYRVDEAGQLGFYCDSEFTVAKSWGNAVFFRDPALFARAVEWCAGHLPQPG